MESIPSVATRSRRDLAGVNGGVGFYSEARCHCAFDSGIPTTLLPVTFGFRLN